MSDSLQQQAWRDSLQAVQTLADLIQTCQDAFVEDDAAPKVCVGAGQGLACLPAGQLVIAHAHCQHADTPC